MVKFKKKIVLRKTYIITCQLLNLIVNDNYFPKQDIILNLIKYNLRTIINNDGLIFFRHHVMLI